MQPRESIIAPKHIGNASALTRSSRLPLGYIPQSCIVYAERVLSPLALPLKGNFPLGARTQDSDEWNHSIT